METITLNLHDVIMNMISFSFFIFFFLVQNQNMVGFLYISAYLRCLKRLAFE